MPAKEQQPAAARVGLRRALAGPVRQTRGLLVRWHLPAGAASAVDRSWRSAWGLAGVTLAAGSIQYGQLSTAGLRRQHQ